ncbi:ribonuclease H [Senna tora]|uniref:Ribonuclease H n=1 Tax=Senna tora TaxID=362788 RepID=A0A835C805_9FABA|nr:ribonuclease H [Senna tora]
MDPTLIPPLAIVASVAATSNERNRNIAVAHGTPNHPTYKEERNRSSNRAIAKYIEKTFTHLLPTHSTLLTLHLKCSKSKGVLVMVKKSYNLTKVFLWSVNHDSVMTNAQRERRGFCNSDSCPLCTSEIETSLHALRDCGKVKEIWKNLLPRDKWQEFFTANLNEWINDCWNSRFPIACWLIWKRRANWVFKNQWQDTDGIIRMVSIYMDGLEEAEVSHADTISCGGVLRDEQGRWIKGFTRKMGKGSSNAWAVKTGLEIACESPSWYDCR